MTSFAHSEMREGQIEHSADSHVQFLKSLMKGSGPGLVRSYLRTQQSYLYDQALAAIVFTHSGKEAEARSILDSLAALQWKSGAWPFVFPSSNPDPFPGADNELDRVTSGSVAWAAIAFNAYRAKYDSAAYSQTLESALKFLEAQARPQNDSQTRFALRFSDRRFDQSKWDQRDVASFEHNIDAYVAFRGYRGKDQSRYFQLSDKIEAFLVSLWNGENFYPGYDFALKRPNSDEIYLDTQSWGYLALHQLKTIPWEKALSHNCRFFLREKESITGFTESNLYSVQNASFIWFEGTGGMALALQYAATQPDHLPVKCGEQETSTTLQKLMTSMEHVSKKGGVPYATPNSHSDFSPDLSVASTAWLYFAKAGFNPLQSGN